MQAIICGVQSIRDDNADVVIAGGVESMSTAPYLLQDARWGFRLQHRIAADIVWMSMQEHPIGGGMGMTAENLAEQYNISREEQDLFALRSQQCAGKAMKAASRMRYHPYPSRSVRASPRCSIQTSIRSLT
jgi:acetyl-CoA C-acetyltransferase